MKGKERYARQLILPEIGEEGQRKLSNAKILIIGVGGLGSPIALYLAGAGVGTIGLVDDDEVNITNLQRQVLYASGQLGQSKAVCAKERILSLNPELEVHAYPFRLTEENAFSLCANYDIIVDGCDNFATRYLIDEVCASLKKPFVHGAIRELAGQVSVFDYENSPTRFSDLFPEQEEILRMPPPPKGVVGVTPGIVGLMEANEVLKLICGYGTLMVGKLWMIDLRTLETHIISL